jgi:hypothetical protein
MDDLGFVVLGQSRGVDHPFFGEPAFYGEFFHAPEFVA